MTTRRRTGTTSTTTETETVAVVRELRKAIRQRAFTDREEQVLRMHLGISEPASAQLEFRGQGHEETRIKLAMMERELLDERRGEGPPDEYAVRKERIIRKLRDL